MEEFQGLLTYSIVNATLKWSKMFGIMEKAKSRLNIEDYSIGQTSLEQVIIISESNHIFDYKIAYRINILLLREKLIVQC